MVARYIYLILALYVLGLTIFTPQAYATSILPSALAASNNLMVADIIVIGSILILCLSAMAAYIYIRKLREENIMLEDAIIYKDDIISSCIAGFCYIDTDHTIIDASPTLKNMLHFLDNVESFQQLINYFEIEEKEKLTQAHQSLYDGRKNFSINLSVDVLSKPKYLTCTGHRINNIEGTMVGALLWFHDVSTHKRSEKRLYSECENLKQELNITSLLMNSVPFAMWHRNAAMDIDYHNLAYSRYVDDALEEYTSSDIDDEPNIKELYNKSRDLAKWANETNKAQNEKQHLIINGERKLFTITEVPIENGEMIGYAQDLTSQEEIESKLKQYISAQSDLLESTSSAMAIYGADTQLQFYNQAFVRLWELDEKWLATKPKYSEILELLREKRKLPEQANFREFKQQHIRMFTNLIEPHNEFFYLPDGKALRVLVIPHALGGLLFAYEDMTDKLAFERSYNTLIAVQRATLDNLHEGVAVFGQNGRLKLSNPTYAKIWHLEPELVHNEPHITDILEKTKFLYRYGNDWDGFKDAIIAQTSKRVPVLQRLERSDGSVIDAMCVPLPDGAALMTYVDVTDSTLVERSLRERNEALEDADRLKSEFLANVSYELRSPLTSIIGFAEVLSKQYFGDLNSNQGEYIDGIYKSSQTLLSLINDILDIASIEAGQMTLDIDEFSIYEVLSSVVPLTKERLRENNIDLTIECKPDIGSMRADERRIRQIIFNLLSNAIKFTDSDGKITLGAQLGDEKDEIVIWIEDNGIGIPSDEQLAVFDKFFKSDSTKLRDTPGTGLGLSVVKNFVELHHGHIELESSPGQGTRITCYFLRNTNYQPSLSQAS